MFPRLLHLAEVYRGVSTKANLLGRVDLGRVLARFQPLCIAAVPVVSPGAHKLPLFLPGLKEPLSLHTPSFNEQ